MKSLKLIDLLFVVTFLSVVLKIDVLADVSCYSCSGIGCQSTTSQTQTVPCTDGCATVYDGHTVIAKGCQSNLVNEYPTECNGTNIDCDKCSQNLCNNLARADLTCLRCDSRESSECIQSPRSLTAQRCPAPTAENVYCFVKYADGTTTRGCATDTRQQKDCDDSSNCQMCLPSSEEQKCNSIVYPSDRNQCIVCSGDECKTESVPSAYCDIATDGCISMKIKGEVQKRCERNISLDDKKYCVERTECCTKCNGNNCNSASFDPSTCGCSKAMATIWLAIAMSFIVFWKF